jgi:hypothetical protein
MPTTEKTYLGDSVYVAYVEGMFVLTTENGYGPNNTIFLEPEVLNALVQFAANATQRRRRIEDMQQES